MCKELKDFEKSFNDESQDRNENYFTSFRNDLKNFKLLKVKRKSRKKN